LSQHKYFYFSSREGLKTIYTEISSWLNPELQVPMSFSKLCGVRAPE
jgi:hypothetical protein